MAVHVLFLSFSLGFKQARQKAEGAEEWRDATEVSESEHVRRCPFGELISQRCLSPSRIQLGLARKDGQ